MSTTATPTRLFRGFSSPNYTSVPDELFDEFLAVLSGAELKVLLYVVRRTFGFKKQSDAISLNQLLDGIVTKDGRRRDHGTGLSRSSLVSALRSLVARGLVIADRRRSPSHGFEATLYRLNVVEARPSSKIELASSENRTSLVRKSDPQQTVRQETGLQPSNIRSASTEKTERRPERSGHRDAQRASSGFEAVSTLLAHRRPADLPANLEGILQPYISEVGRAFGDRAPLASSTMRAANLLRRAGVRVEVFIARLYEARSLTRERARAHDHGRSEVAASRSVKLQMAYFFSVLEDLLGLRERLPEKAAA